jgi:predicted O-methyltransferase YrrM
MSDTTTNLTPKLYDYLQNKSLRESDILKKLREETKKTNMQQMQISPEQGQFMQLLIEILAAEKTLDIGTFTGYSALSVALALPKTGKVISCDVSEEWTKMAQSYWALANVTHKIDLKLAPALTTLDNLINSGQKESFDFAFIDADKQNYINYYEKSLILLRKGGLIAIDNVLWEGKVADNNIKDPNTTNIRELNAKLHNDERVSISMLPIGDGLTLARKR